MDQIKRISCDPECGFAVQSHIEDEVVDVAAKHVKEKHGKSVSDKELRGMITTPG
jgi:predicted small metal-binding protein